jgi:Mor family transcriptional regulator
MKMRNGRPRKQINENILIKQYWDGVSSKNLSLKYEISVSAVLGILKKNNVSIRKKGSKTKFVSLLGKLDLNKIKERYLAGESCNVIAKDIGVQHHMVESWLKKEGVELRGMTGIGNCNDIFFSKIDSEEKAYWLGFFAADGNVSKIGYRVQISLSKKDRAHVELFKKHIGAVSEVRDDARGFSTLSFKNKVFWNNVCNAGIGPNKTLDLKKPKVIQELDKHFWRGMIDGDGCIPELSRAGSGRYVVELVGTKDICQSFLDYCGEIYGYKCGSLINYKTWFKASLEGQSAKMVLSDLYGGATVFLQRKMDLAMRKQMDISDGISEIGQKLASEFFKENHYLYSSPVGMTCIGLWKNKILLGVAAFGVTSSMGVAESIFGVDQRNKVIELRRFALKAGSNVPNMASEFLAKSIDKISLIKPDIWAIVAFSDENVGHYGTIYKACNAYYLGKTEGGIIAKDKDGKIYSGRHLNKIKSLDGITFDIDKGRHKFVFIVGRRDQKKERIILLKSRFSFVSQVTHGAHVYQHSTSVYK